MSTIFNTVTSTPQDFSTFNLGHQRKMTLKPGELVPILVEEVIPGDRFKISHSQIVRAQPMLAPLMHEVEIKTYFFFVPNRILFDEKFGSDKTNPWVQFIRGGDSGTDTLPIPYLENINTQEIHDENYNLKKYFGTSSLWDYMGLPAIIDQDILTGDLGGTLPDIQLMPFLAYHKIWNDYFRAESLQPEFDFLEALKIGANDTEHLVSEDVFFKQLLSIKKKAWEHDMFTSALPSPQRGAPVTLPIYGQAPLRFDNELGQTTIHPSDGQTYTGNETFSLYAGSESLLQTSNPANQINSNINIADNHYVDLSQAVATTIQDFRKAVKLQEWLELGMRTGTRYFEFIKAYSDVNVRDERLQRAEFMGGSTSNIIISEVVQQSATQDSTPLGDMAGHGINIGNSDGIFTKFVEEYGYIIGLAVILPRTAYQNTVPRHFLKKDKFDVFTAQFQHVGEQAMMNQEVNYNWIGSKEINEDTFGYVPRYTEYKYHNSSVHGDFQDSLNYWVWNRKFSQRETIGLNSDFISATPSRDIFAYTDMESDPFLAHFNFHITAKRQMSYLGEPKFA